MPAACERARRADPAYAAVAAAHAAMDHQIQRLRTV
jgi:hypothetical protein